MYAGIFDKIFIIKNFLSRCHVLCWPAQLGQQKKSWTKTAKAAKNEEEGKGKNQNSKSFNRHTPLTWNKLNTSFFVDKTSST